MDSQSHVTALYKYNHGHGHFSSPKPSQLTSLLAKMARGMLALAPLVLFLLYISGTAESAAAMASTNFIKVSCRSTTFPALCVQSLSLYATTIRQSPQQMAQTALSVSLAKAQFTKTYVTRLTKFKGLKAREYGAIKDCLEEIVDTVDRLSKSVEELKSMGRARGQAFIWHMSNIETWVSAALTDENTCMDGFSGRTLDGKIKASVRAQFTQVGQVTSNALALINKFAANH
ncbi:hypothetical protein RJ639_027810 [Escallonia herrerae]|uniref:Pectinesterase inhibitor domain-containing protein n=1 Tax=Escallonia herrerae TaxID=1293975 RepID=A0AA88X7N7_9ASTE|nr:hypothetical protein RJ639_027810 [Escallonia herrerae]